MLVHYNQVNLSLDLFCQYERDFGIAKLQKAFVLKILSVMIQTSDILYYEVLDIPLPELQFLKTLKVAFHHATKEEVLFTANHMLIFFFILSCQMNILMKYSLSRLSFTASGFLRTAPLLM
jgi:hypothetical protein